jgi:hypothetical protein
MPLCVLVVACGAEDDPQRATRSADAGPVQRLAAAGPALGDRSIVWGEEYRDGSLAVVRKRLGQRAEVIRRIAAPNGKDRQRSFLGVPGALSASEHWIAYGLDDAKVVADGDSVSIEANARAFASRNGGAFRDVLPQCDGAAYISTASDGDGVAIGQPGATCDGKFATRVWLIEGGEPPRLIYESAEEHVGMRQVQLAGPWIAWSEGGSGGGDTKITVARRATGEVVSRLTTKDFAGGHGFSAFDIDDDGNVVALSGPQPRCYYVCVTVRSVTGQTTRTISRRAIGGKVAIAGGRIAYVGQRRLHPTRLIITRLDGRVVRRLDRFGRSRRPLHDLALTDDRVAWAVLKSAGDEVPDAPGGIRSVPLR